MPPAAHTGLKSEFRWRERGEDFRARLRAIGEQRKSAPPAGAVPDHEVRNGPRSVDGTIWWLTEEQSAELLAACREARTSMTGYAGALWAEAIADHVVPADGSPRDEENPPSIGISIPVDMRSRVNPKIAFSTVGTYVSMLNATVPVAGGTTAERAREIGNQMRQAIKDGEPELFYAITRPDALPFSEKGDARMQAMLDCAPQAITVSNLGVVDDAGDPAWVDRFFGTFIPMQNQVAYVVPSLYRGKMTLMVSADTSRLTSELAKKVLTWPVPLASGDPDHELLTNRGHSGLGKATLQQL